jgi:hypothetical protein
VKDFFKSLSWARAMKARTKLSRLWKRAGQPGAPGRRRFCGARHYGGGKAARQLTLPFRRLLPLPRNAGLITKNTHLNLILLNRKRFSIANVSQSQTQSLFSNRALAKYSKKAPAKERAKGALLKSPAISSGSQIIGCCQYCAVKRSPFLFFFVSHIYKSQKKSLKLDLLMSLANSGIVVSFLAGTGLT